RGHPAEGAYEVRELETPAQTLALAGPAIQSSKASIDFIARQWRSRHAAIVGALLISGTGMR
ncbi:MAG TPA: hypothetical protein VL172_13520, partial [Kofleriaceae bacterium]|nr:hypothetical protein [Kofleriaceae bacterium]